MIEKHTLEILGKAIALAAFVFSVSTYSYNLYDSRQKERYKQATKLVADYSNSGIRARENELAARLLFYTPDGITLNDPESYPEALFSDIAKETLFGFTGGGDTAKPFLQDLLKITDFYAQVKFCNDAGICDTDILTQFFCPKAQNFAQSNRRLLTYYEDFANTNDISNGFASFATACEDANG